MPFTLYRSSAGSGKTYTLVKEYLKLVLKDQEKFKHTLAITFTNKAAGEMKERILKALKNLAKGEDKNLEKTLTSELPQLRNIDKISSQLLTTILHNYSDFAIMTIDSFIHRVIKSFALEIGLPLNFGIDLNYEKIETYVIERLYSKVGKDPNMTEIILKFVFSRIDENKSWRIEEDIRQFEKELFSEKNIDWIKAITQAFTFEAFQDYMKQLNDIRFQFIGTIQSLGQRGLQLIENAHLTIDDFPYKEAGAAGFLMKCANMRPGDIKEKELPIRFKTGQWTAKSSPKDIRAGIEALLENGLSEIADEIIRYWEKYHAEALTATFILENVYLIAILNTMTELIEEYKKKNNVIPISEFNTKVHEIVRNSPVPFIYSIIGEKYNHYLVDEFQDTSRLQWDNLFPLIENAMSSNFFNMAVGDGKQSIYRWRGGDMEIMEKDVPERFLPEQFKLKLLEKNFRSKAHIIDFNNRFFSKISEFHRDSHPFLSEVYSDVSQVCVKNQNNFVSLHFIPGSSGETDPDNVSSSDEKVFTCVKEIIEECESYGFEKKDIAILVRENKKGQMVAEYLLKQGIPVVSPDSLILSKIPLIRFLIAILKYLTNPSEKIAQAVIIFFLCLNKKENKIDPTAIGNAFTQDKPWDISPELEQFILRRETLIRMPVYEVVEDIIRVFDLSNSLDFQTSGYLQAFLDIVASYTSENSLDLSSFLDWWETGKEEFTVMVPETKSAVKIMSIHKAKGLEFPVVIIPYADWEHKVDKQLWLYSEPCLKTDPPLDIPMPVKGLKKLKDSHFSSGYRKEKDKVLIDNINLLYVAFTRAEDHLYIIAKENEKRGKDEEELNNFDYLKEFAVPLMAPVQNVEGRYYYGEPVIKKTHDLPVTAGIDAITTVEIGELISNNWDSRMTIRRKSTEFWRFDKSSRSDRVDMGILVHQLLADIRTVDDIEKAIAKNIFSGTIEISEGLILEEKIRELFTNELFRDWFTPKRGDQVYIESPIVTKEGILIPDRVVISGGRVSIIDFKTGKKNNEYTHQLLKYKKAISDIGYSDVNAFIFYIDANEFEHVVDDVYDAKN